MQDNLLIISFLLLILLFLLLTRNILWILYFLVNGILIPINLFLIHLEEKFSLIGKLCSAIAILTTFSIPFLLPWPLFSVLNALVLPINICLAILFSLSALYRFLTPLFLLLIPFLLLLIIPIMLFLKSIFTPFSILVVGMTNKLRHH